VNPVTQTQLKVWAEESGDETKQILAALVQGQSDLKQQIGELLSQRNRESQIAPSLFVSAGPPPVDVWKAAKFTRGLGLGGLTGLPPNEAEIARNALLDPLPSVTTKSG
jgi:hypothetical protein